MGFVSGNVSAVLSLKASTLIVAGTRLLRYVLALFPAPAQLFVTCVECLETRLDTYVQ